MKDILLALTFAFSSSVVSGGGSESFNDHLLPIIKEEKIFKDIQGEYIFSDSIWAQIRIGSYTNFGGLRLGPYTVLAKKKNDSEWSQEIIFKTTYKFYDKDSNEVHFTSSEATSYTEKLTHITINSNNSE